MKTKKILIYIAIVIIASVTIAYFWGDHWHSVYCNGANVFFLRNRMTDFRDAFCDSVKEEFLWRFIPLFTISCILSLLKFESKKVKKNILCSLSFLIVVLLQIGFSLIHYNPIYQTEDWILKHIVIQGTTGVFLAVAYNVIQYNVKKMYNKHLITSHLVALICSCSIHYLVDILLIISQTR